MQRTQQRHCFRCFFQQNRSFKCFAVHRIVPRIQHPIRELEKCLVTRNDKNLFYTTVGEARVTNDTLRVVCCVTLCWRIVVLTGGKLWQWFVDLLKKVKLTSLMVGLCFFRKTIEDSSGKYWLFRVFYVIACYFSVIGQLGQFTFIIFGKYMRLISSINRVKKQRVRTKEKTWVVWDRRTERERRKQERDRQR